MACSWCWWQCILNQPYVASSKTSHAVPSMPPPLWYYVSCLQDEIIINRMGLNGSLQARGLKGQSACWWLIEQVTFKVLIYWLKWYFHTYEQVGYISHNTSFLKPLFSPFPCQLKWVASSFARRIPIILLVASATFTPLVMQTWFT